MLEAASMPAITPAPNRFNNLHRRFVNNRTFAKAITAAYRRPETECLPPLVEAARAPADLRAPIRGTARKLIEALRAKHKGTGVEGPVREYSLSSQEGVALMCLAEALLRILDTATRDAPIRDRFPKATGNRMSVAAARSSSMPRPGGLVVTGKLTSTVNDRSLAAAQTRLIARCGEPVIRRGVDMATRLVSLPACRQLAFKRSLSDALHPRGRLLLAPKTEEGLYRQIAAALATGNQLVIDVATGLRPSLKGLPVSVADRITWSTDWDKDGRGWATGAGSDSDHG
ncbi:hypothetical protein NKI44_18895 [Mesorhizobium sp. M0614]|uniref:hypothetical protein n=1 Tax=Mesorhizobium sp. M0614 TaxID=2956970 RepID=UPI00333609AC